MVLGLPDTLWRPLSIVGRTLRRRRKPFAAQHEEVGAGQRESAARLASRQVSQTEPPSTGGCLPHPVHRPAARRASSRFHRRTVERRAKGLCPTCGKRPPAPDRSLCEHCADKQCVAGRARDARLRAAFVRFSGHALAGGVKRHPIEGIEVPTFEPAKSIVDCFRYRNKIGLDIALERLREGLRSGRVTPDELWEFARTARVWSVMRPYVEAMVADGA